MDSIKMMLSFLDGRIMVDDIYDYDESRALVDPLGDTFVILWSDFRILRRWKEGKSRGVCSYSKQLLTPDVNLTIPARRVRDIPNRNNRP